MRATTAGLLLAGLGRGAERACHQREAIDWRRPALLCWVPLFPQHRNRTPPPLSHLHPSSPGTPRLYLYYHNARSTAREAPGEEETTT